MTRKTMRKTLHEMLNDGQQHTPEEVAAAEVEFVKQFDRVQKAMKVIPRIPGATGTVLCPTCGKSMRYRVSVVNGHRRAKCETKDCVNFIE
jgi:hypothetical protein